MEGLLTLIIIGAIIYYFVNKNKKKKYKGNFYSNFYHKNQDNYNPSNVIIQEDINYNKKEEQKNEERNIVYRKREFLTPNEKRYYSFLIKYAENRNLQLISKIRLADLIEVDTRYAKKYIDQQVSFSKIRAKHIDFALCNKKDLEPVLLIEIDDKSHNEPERIERDKFIDDSLRNSGYKIIHIRYLNNLEYTLDFAMGYKV